MADPGDDFYFDLYVTGDEVAVWLDLSPMVDQGQLDQLLEGANLGFEFTFRLDIPRRLFNDQTAVLKRQSAAISYNLVTETFSIGLSRNDFDPPVLFHDIGDFREYLADSVSFQICSFDDLASDQQYVLKINVVRLSMSEPAGGAEHPLDLSDETLLKAVFRQFLDWTAFGRQEFNAKSRPLVASELVD